MQDTMTFTRTFNCAFDLNIYMFARATRAAIRGIRSRLFHALWVQSSRLVTEDWRPAVVLRYIDIVKLAYPASAACVCVCVQRMPVEMPLGLWPD